MLKTELKPILLNLSDEDTEEETAGPSFLPEEDGDTESGASKNSGMGAGEDGFDLDSDLIENPGEEEF